MKEIKITEGIIIDEPNYVVQVINNLCGKKAEFELIKKFILNEKNTIYYIDKKMNSSVVAGTYHDYIWLDTGYRDYRNNPIMICLHHSYDGYIGHYTAVVRELANRVKVYNRKNAKDIEKNFSRFIEKYKRCTGERVISYIDDEVKYAIEIANRENLFGQETSIAIALKQANVEVEDEYIEEIDELGNDSQSEEAFTEMQQEITVGLLFDQMKGMQNYIDDLLIHIENNEKESKEEINALIAQNNEYKKALVNIRNFMENEEQSKEEAVVARASGHNLLKRNEKILVLGNTDIRVAEMKAIARDYFGFEKADFEFITDYEKIKNAGNRIHSCGRFVAVIFGNCPHKVAGMGNFTSIIEEFKQREDCPLSIDARNEAGGLKITKQSFKNALLQVYANLKALKVA